MLDEGAEGMLQAVVLSFGGLQFTKKYLQLQTDTDILHNEIAFHSVLYQDSLLDVAINTGEEGSVTVSVKLISLLFSYCFSWYFNKFLLDVLC